MSGECDDCGEHCLDCRCRNKSPTNIWKKTNERPIQSVPLLVVRQFSDLVIGDGGLLIAYADDHGFQGPMGKIEEDEIGYWCYMGELLNRAPFPCIPGRFATDDALNAWLRKMYNSTEEK